MKKIPCQKNNKKMFKEKSDLFYHPPSNRKNCTEEQLFIMGWVGKQLSETSCDQKTLSHPRDQTYY